MYVVGFIGFDGALGRTYICDSELQVKLTVEQFIREQKEAPPFDDYWDEHCVFETCCGYFFVGKLETP